MNPKTIYSWDALCSKIDAELDGYDDAAIRAVRNTTAYLYHHISKGILCVVKNGKLEPIVFQNLTYRNNWPPVKQYFFGSELTTPDELNVIVERKKPQGQILPYEQWSCNGHVISNVLYAYSPLRQESYKKVFEMIELIFL